MVVRMRLARENHLDRSLLVGEKTDQPVGVCKEKVRPFVRGKPAGEADGEGVGRKGIRAACELGVGDATAGKLLLQAEAGECHHPLSAALVRPPQLLV